ncbi:hypothetical protein GO986_18015 [Deinococcus sp. HMF7620]|uniref:Uncharacterized protein n=1 Tax=Deinococcus arboris TaxID=2682977 RepID=A0A7C9I1H7_9DEIO|nr:hypothetical protein [Deinococcus arboris]MVN88635.1 hypothetical protein [Deinococcus arboris]
MRVDARPFFKLVTPSGTVTKCLRPDFNGRSVGVGGGTGPQGLVSVVATHTVMVFNPLASDLVVNAAVTLNDTTPPGRYRVLQVATEPAGATVYLAADPAEGEAPYQPDQPDDPPRTGQRLPYVASDS